MMEQKTDPQTRSYRAVISLVAEQAQTRADIEREVRRLESVQREAALLRAVVEAAREKRARTLWVRINNAVQHRANLLFAWCELGWFKGKALRKKVLEWLSRAR